MKVYSNGVVRVKYKTKTCEANAFQWNLKEPFPDWFKQEIEIGNAFVVINHQKESYIYVENKRGKYKGFENDWVVVDQFGHLHVVSAKTFGKRYELSNL